jgi:toxin ParE1/3/4
VNRRVVFSPEARDDLRELALYIAANSGRARARGYVARIRDCCIGLSAFPARGAPRDEIRPGLRIIGFERRAAILFHFDDRTVTIDRILYGGRSLGVPEED